MLEKLTNFANAIVEASVIPVLSYNKSLIINSTVTLQDISPNDSNFLIVLMTLSVV